MRHDNVRDFLKYTVARDSQMPSCIEPASLVPDTHGRGNHDRPADVFVGTALACSTPGADKSALAIDDTVFTTDTAPLAGMGRSTATRAEERKTAAWVERVANIIAALKAEGRPVWTPTFEYRGFGLDV